ncbi:unannotated protein [freshwater metagenome]|uniref:Unannotated protein n=1 Tax=freshwater metagenome TaxID=449393 RepID=A0A6J6GFU6_9ZZZZ
MPSRFSIIGAKTSGITSPAFRIKTVSPIKIPFLIISWLLCNVALVIVDPATFTGSIKANGVTRPVLPTLTRISINLVLTCSGGYL